MYRFITSSIRVRRSAENPVFSAVPVGTLAAVDTKARSATQDDTRLARRMERMGAGVMAVLVLESNFLRRVGSADYDRSLFPRIKD
jgi:hypothetical protein